MPDQNVATAMALVDQVHAEALNHVEVTSVHRDIVAVAFGDDRSGVRLLCPLCDVHRLVVEADRQLARITTRDHR